MSVGTSLDDEEDMLRELEEEAAEAKAKADEERTSILVLAREVNQIRRM